MENKTTNKWEMNDTQKEFVKILSENKDGITLFDIKAKYGKEFNTGSINTLKSKGIVNTDTKIKVQYDKVFNGEVIGVGTATWTVYKLVNLDD